MGAAGAALQPVAQSASPMVEVAALRVSPGAASMRCRTNLKKDKRIRNRVNAFRFKKAVPFRFARAGPKKEDSKEAAEDAAHYAQARSRLSPIPAHARWSAPVSSCTGFG